LIFANEVSNIVITGFGTIDGNGAQQKPHPNALKGDLDGRPRNILFISCKNIRVEGIRMVNAGIWNQHYLNCEDVIVDRINVYNHANRNNDGIDIDGCRRFTLSNSTFDTDDDAIVLKSTGPAGCENIVITNCIVSSFCNAIKAGT
jgi:polygalacturonase